MLADSTRFQTFFLLVNEKKSHNREMGGDKFEGKKKI